MMLLAIAWAAFYTLHSLLAANGVKRWVSEHTLIRPGRSYRLFYNTMSLLLFLVLLMLHSATPSKQWFSAGTGWMIAGVLLIGCGLLLGLLALRTYNGAAFLGLQEEDNRRLNTNGLNAYMRHPLYTATLLLILGFCLVQPVAKNWMVLMLTFLYLLIGMRLEEKKLIELFGEDYIRYRQKVKKLIPYLF